MPENFHNNNANSSPGKLIYIHRLNFPGICSNWVSRHIQIAKSRNFIPFFLLGKTFWPINQRDDQDQKNVRIILS